LLRKIYIGARKSAKFSGMVILFATDILRERKGEEFIGEVKCSSFCGRIAGVAMRVGIDARMIGWSGIGRYTDHLIKGITEFGEGVEPVLFCDRDNAHEIPGKSNLERHYLRTKVFSLSAPLKLRREFAQYGFDILHTPHFVSPLGRTTYPVVITIHDLTPIIIGGTMPSLVRKAYYYLYNLFAARNAKAIIVPSNSTKNDVVKMLGVAQSKVEVVYESVDEIFGRVDSDIVLRTKEKFDIKGEFIFALGNQKPNKGLEYLIDAYYEVINKHQLRHELVLTGTPSSKFKGVAERIGKYGLEQKVRFIGGTTDDELVGLYNGASVFVFPSLYEGFGLPPLEAMACGTPVIASNRSSVPEVVGDAAVIVNPLDVGALADAIVEVVTDEDKRSSLVERGHRRVNDFSLEQFARETLDVYKQVLGR